MSYFLETIGGNELGVYIFATNGDYIYESLNGYDFSWVFGCKEDELEEIDTEDPGRDISFVKLKGESYCLEATFKELILEIF